MIVRLAGEQDLPGLLDLAGQVEPWFGPMAGDPGFRAALGRHIRRGTALVAVAAGQAGVLGGPAAGLSRALAGGVRARARAGRGPDADGGGDAAVRVRPGRAGGGDVRRRPPRCRGERGTGLL
jgi:hypothetical protein